QMGIVRTSSSVLIGVGIKEEDAACRLLPIGAHGVGVEQLQIGNEVSSIVGGQCVAGRRNGVWRGRAAWHSCSPETDIADEAGPGSGSLHTIVDKLPAFVRPSPSAWICGGLSAGTRRRSGLPRA